jgi:hypothetical protein
MIIINVNNASENLYFKKKIHKIESRMANIIKLKEINLYINFIGINLEIHVYGNIVAIKGRNIIQYINLL